ncbi:MAG: hypothetical protein MI924_04185 [Chloroflexales bacterium]|nr:hypothetical protein [Chloroflexales bacterium]
MARQDALSEWTTCVSRNLPQRSKAQATVLALWSYGIAMTRSCGRSTVATVLALRVGQKVAAIEQRLDEWCLDAKDKAGSKRCDVAVTSCVVPLLTWVLRLWTGKQRALTLDATALSDRFVVLAVCVVYRGSAIPVAGQIRAGGRKGAWRPHWLRFLRQLKPAMPTEMKVLALSDRGLWARWLFHRIVCLGWRPFLRINQGATFRPFGTATVVWLRALAGAVGQRWRGSGTDVVSQDCQLDCTLVAWWGAGHAAPWFVLTDLAAAGCDAVWYGWRGWCEQSFTSTKRGGQWQQTQMKCPRRAARLWRALAVASLWAISVGSDRDVGPAANAAELPDLSAMLGRRPPTRPRVLRLLRLGWLWLLVQQIHGNPIPLPRRLVPEPWPAIPR